MRRAKGASGFGMTVFGAQGRENTKQRRPRRSAAATQAGRTARCGAIYQEGGEDGLATMRRVDLSGCFLRHHARLGGLPFPIVFGGRSGGGGAAGGLRLWWRVDS